MHKTSILGKVSAASNLKYLVHCQNCRKYIGAVFDKIDMKLVGYVKT